MFRFQEYSRIPYYSSDASLQRNIDSNSASFEELILIKAKLNVKMRYREFQAANPKQAREKHEKLRFYLIFTCNALTILRYSTHNRAWRRIKRVLEKIN